MPHLSDLAHQQSHLSSDAVQKVLICAGTKPDKLLDDHSVECLKRLPLLCRVVCDCLLLSNVIVDQGMTLLVLSISRGSSTVVCVSALVCTYDDLCVDTYST